MGPGLALGGLGVQEIPGGLDAARRLLGLVFGQQRQGLGVDQRLAAVVVGGMLHGKIGRVVGRRLGRVRVQRDAEVGELALQVGEIEGVVVRRLVRRAAGARVQHGGRVVVEDLVGAGVDGLDGLQRLDGELGVPPTRGGCGGRDGQRGRGGWRRRDRGARGGRWTHGARQHDLARLVVRIGRRAVAAVVDAQLGGQHRGLGARDALGLNRGIEQRDLGGAAAAPELHELPERDARLDLQQVEDAAFQLLVERGFGHGVGVLVLWRSRPKASLGAVRPPRGGCRCLRVWRGRASWRARRCGTDRGGSARSRRARWRGRVRPRVCPSTR
jgi:hypothetical protein